MVTVVIRDNGSGQITSTVTYDQDGPVFTNTKTTFFTVQKTVAGNRGDQTSDFEFTLELSDPEITSVRYEKEGTPGVLELTDGRGIFTLKHSEQIKFTGLTEGVTATVTEEDNDYTVTVNGEEARGGTIEVGTDSRLAFINTLQSVDIPVYTYVPPMGFIPIIIGAGGGIGGFFTWRNMKKKKTAS